MHSLAAQGADMSSEDFQTWNISEKYSRYFSSGLNSVQKSDTLYVPVSVTVVKKNV